MGLTKTFLFNNKQNNIASMAKVLAHPARVAILEYIAQQDQCQCNDVVEKTGLAQPTVSQHMAVLKKAGLIKGKYSGRNYYCCVNNTKLDQFKDAMSQFLETINTVNE